MKKRPGFELRNLVAVGGEAESPVDPSFFEPPLSSESNSLRYIPHCPAIVLDAHTTGSGATDAGRDAAAAAAEDMFAADEDVDRVAEALVREYLNKKKMTAVLKAFDDANPRNPASISSRAKLRIMLGLGEPHKSFGVLEQVIAQRLVDTRRGHHVTLGDAPMGSGEMWGLPREVNWGWGTNQNGSTTVLVGGYTIDETGAKVQNCLPPPRSFCDLSANKIIDHLGDLEMSERESLGKGVSGEVYKVLHKPTGKHVAVKMIKAAESRQMEEVSKELSTLFTNMHRNIVTYHGSFYDNEGHIAIALELMAGSLNGIITPGSADTSLSRLPEKAAKACIYQALHGLNHLHTERKVLHRDIKPANILYNNEGEVKISDFGVASNPVATMDGNVATTFIGTLAYMSPERCSGQEYSFPSEVWSLGLVLYYLLVGRVPYVTANALFAIIEGEPPALGDQIPAGSGELSPNAYDFYKKCVAKSPQARATCKELILHPWFRCYTDTQAREALAEYL
eukprot:Rhum_TRINITY_DN11326_c0_g1::Rhum_TRINITY_DN11326_c0_g1_i1::g.43951::m.43951